jgi:hypothetical protein
MKIFFDGRWLLATHSYCSCLKPNPVATQDGKIRTGRMPQNRPECNAEIVTDKNTSRQTVFPGFWLSELLELEFTSD